MNVLVTGSTGFLGRYLTAELIKRGYTVFEAHSKTCDLTKENSLNQFHSVKFDKIFHLAAWTQAGDFCLKYPGEQWLINQKINTHVLNFWVEKQPQATLYCMGTSCAYDPTLPLEEKYYLAGEPIDSLFTYAMTKRMLLSGLLAIHKQYHLNFLYLIPSTLYGPHYHTDNRQLHFIFDLIRKIQEGVQKGSPVILWGDGHQKRELIHIRDFIEILFACIDSGITNTILNVGGGKEYSIREFAQMICLKTGYPFEKIQFDLSKYVGAKSKILSIEKLKKLLPNYIPLPLEKGLSETITWFANKAPL